MSFVNALVKGFVRSAVNQVGRDGGKVISNKIYNNGHSSPYRGIKQESTNRDQLIDSGYKEPKFLSSTWILYPFLLLGYSILPFIGPVLLLTQSGKYFLKKKSRLYMYEQTPVYKSDRRFSTGKKIVGYNNTRTGHIDVDIKKGEKALYMTKGVLYLLLGLILSYWHYTIWNGLK
jgi:hypothetical protein